ncbi:MAG: hypothetical protein EP298_07415 [Gammaproteobacteria bacterium]|nr:MAG: hypothetical protein EP298_07415 [Gammaproteobacteria bacterium]UTW42661.1 hypothetical protein KFE69_00510 [bacterium SCSIO 12844]
MLKEINIPSPLTLSYDQLVRRWDYKKAYYDASDIEVLYEILNLVSHDGLAMRGSFRKLTLVDTCIYKIKLFATKTEEPSEYLEWSMLAHALSRKLSKEYACKKYKFCQAGFIYVPMFKEYILQTLKSFQLNDIKIRNDEVDVSVEDVTDVNLSECLLNMLENGSIEVNSDNPCQHASDENHIIIYFYDERVFLSKNDDDLPVKIILRPLVFNKNHLYINTLDLLQFEQKHSESDLSNNIDPKLYNELSDKFFNPNSRYYLEEMHIALQAAHAIYVENYGNPKHGTHRRIKTWIHEHYPFYAEKDFDGEFKETAPLKRLCTIATAKLDKNKNYR